MVILTAGEKYEKQLEKMRKQELKRLLAKSRKAEAEERKQLSIERMNEKKAERQKELNLKREEERKEKLRDRRRTQRIKKFDNFTKTTSKNLIKAITPRQTPKSEIARQERLMKLRIKEMKQRERLMRMASMSPPDHVRGGGSFDTEDHFLNEGFQDVMSSTYQENPATKLEKRGIRFPFGLFGGMRGFNSNPSEYPSEDLMSQLGRQNIRPLESSTNQRIAGGKSSILLSGNSLGLNDPRHYNTGSLMRPQEVIRDDTRKISGEKNKLRFW